MAGIIIDYNEYHGLLTQIEQYHSKILEIEQNQQKILLETEQHTYEHVKGTKAVNLITKDIRYINLDEFKQIYKQDLYKEFNEGRAKQDQEASKTIDALTTHNKSCLENLSHYKTEINDLRKELIDCNSKFEKGVKSYQRQLRHKDNKYNVDIEILESKYNSKILETNAIKQKNLTIESLTAERDLLIRQLKEGTDKISELNTSISNYRKQTFFYRLFNKI